MTTRDRITEALWTCLADCLAGVMLALALVVHVLTGGTDE